MSKWEVAINVRNGMAVGVCITPITYIKKEGEREYDVTSGVFRFFKTLNSA